MYESDDFATRVLTPEMMFSTQFDRESLFPEMREVRFVALLNLHYCSGLKPLVMDLTVPKLAFDAMAIGLPDMFGTICDGGSSFDCEGDCLLVIELDIELTFHGGRVFLNGILKEEGVDELPTAIQQLLNAYREESEDDEKDFNPFGGRSPFDDPMFRAVLEAAIHGDVPFNDPRMTWAKDQRTKPQERKPDWMPNWLWELWRAI